MIIDMTTAAFSVADGVATATLHVKTDGGKAIVNLQLKLSEHPQLDALVPLIDEAVQEVAARKLGMSKSLITTPRA